MKNITNTTRTVTELDSFLLDNGYFEDEQEIERINTSINALWAPKIQDSIRADLAAKNKNIVVDFTFSGFNLSDDRAQGACIFINYADVGENNSKEVVGVIVKSVINYNKTFVYLDSQYANVMKHDGESKVLRSLFSVLKKSDQKDGYFNPLTMEELIF